MHNSTSNTTNSLILFLLPILAKIPRILPTRGTSRAGNHLPRPSFSLSAYLLFSNRGKPFDSLRRWRAKKPGFFVWNDGYEYPLLPLLAPAPAERFERDDSHITGVLLADDNDGLLVRGSRPGLDQPPPPLPPAPGRGEGLRERVMGLPRKLSVFLSYKN